MDAFVTDAVGDGILIRYDGLDADRHEIEVGDLAKSLQGLSRILGVTANFAATQKLVLHQDARAVRVVIKPPQAHCFEMIAFVRWASENPLFSTAVGGFLSTLLTYVFLNAANKKEEMKHLSGALEAAIKELGTRDQKTVDRLLGTIDKMADALVPAAKQAVTPIGSSASTLTIGPVNSAARTVLGEAEKDAILSEAGNEVGDEATFRLTITELDTDTGGAHVRLEHEADIRLAAKITDPAFALPNNGYAVALASQHLVAVRAKPTLKDGRIQKLFISNLA